jgi:hypothetical protein
MTDRELMQMAFDVLDVYREHDAKGEGFADQVYEMLHNRLAQPKREWVGQHLTNSEIDNILSKIVHPDALGFYQSNAIYNVFRKFAKAIETKLKEKNT